MMKPKILGRGKICLCTRKVLAVAEYVNFEVEAQDHVEGNDVSKFKVAISKDVELTDAPSAMRYIARKHPDSLLYGKTNEEMASVDSWLSYQEANFMVPYLAWLQWEKLGGSCLEKIKADLMANLESRVEKHLLNNTFLATERITIADINLALILDSALVLDKDLTKKFPNTQRWFNTVIAPKAVKGQLSYDSPWREPKAGAAKKDATTKKEPEKKEGAKKEKSAADIEDEIAAEEKARASKANVLDSLPPTPFVLDAWKREYSNTKELRKVAMPWFWTNFDAPGWSLWFMRYDKMEGENTVGYITANMLRGFIQRLDPNFRKYSFAVLNVIGETGNFDIQGVWLMRGHEIPNELKEHPSFEYHTFRKLDAAADKALIEDYWCNDDKVDGRPIDACNVWK